VRATAAVPADLQQLMASLRADAQAAAERTRR